MARLSKVCHSSRCGGTKQPAQLTLVPNRAAVTYAVTCLSCNQVHPSDSSEMVRDGKAWARAMKAAHGGIIPIPLPQE